MSEFERRLALVKPPRSKHKFKVFTDPENQALVRNQDLIIFKCENCPHYMQVERETLKGLLAGTNQILKTIDWNKYARCPIADD